MRIQLVSTLPILWMLPLLLLPLGCGTDPADSNSVPPESTTVTVADPVMATVLQQLVGESIEFYCPDVPAGVAITDEQIDRILASKLIVQDGSHGGSSWAQQISIPQARTMNSAFAILEELIYVPNLSSHSHGPGQEHSHGGNISETWLDPQLFAKQINSVLDTLVARGFLSDTASRDASAKWQEWTADLNQELSDLRSNEPSDVLVDGPGTEYLCRRLQWQPQIINLNHLAAEDPADLKKQLQSWLNRESRGPLILTQPPSEPLKDVLNELKADYTRLDISPDSFLQDSYVTAFQSILDKLKH